VPNHHAHHGGFSGFRGYLIGFSFLFGRDQVGGWAADLAGVQPGDAVIDIGCGPGGAARLAAKRGATVLAVDPAPVMLRLGRLFTRGRRVKYRAGTAEALPVEDGAVTVAWSLSTVHHWADIDGGLDEVQRVLQPGGRFVAIEANTSAGASGHGWTEGQAERFAELCRDHGFVNVRIERGTADKRARIAVVAER
jgi:ubiquinone/menaquinone biosynthesis C-methylase UbiE